jgi:VWFA-related protein
MLMTRATVVLSLAVAAGLLEVGGGRPLAAQQTSGAQGTVQPPATEPAPTPPSPQSDDTPQQPTFRADINYVRVDVIVNDDKGRPVTDLKISDFEVLEDGKPQSIDQFRLVRVDGNPLPGAPPPRELRNRIDEEIEISKDDVRLFVFFFDDYHVRLGNALSVKEPLIRFVQTQLRPNDVVGMMYPLTPVDGISFTRNHASVISAIENFEGRKFDYRPRNTFEEQYARAPSEIVEQIRNQVVMTALRGLSTRLGGLREGRKAVIYVSEGLTAMLPPQLRTADASMGRIGSIGRTSPMTGENSQREETAAFFNESDLYSQLREVFTAANRNNTAIYSVDPRGLAPFEFGIDEAVGPNQDARSLRMTQDSLRSLSEETDGRAIVNRNDLAPGLAQIVRDSSYYYLLGYSSTQAPTDGKFHQISVRLKRRGLDVRARKGYWALTAEEVVRAMGPAKPEVVKPVQQALASIAPSVQAGKYVRTWLGTARGDQGKTRVTLIWEPLPQTPGVRRDQPQPGRMSVLAADAKGDLVFRGRVPDGSAATTPEAAAGVRPGAAAPAATMPAAQRLVFDAAPGELELRLSVEGVGGGVLDSEIRRMTVPDLTSPDAAVSTPRVYRVRTARELQAIASDATAVPTAGREFSRTERLLIRFDVYGNATPAAALLNRNGEKMTDLPVAPATAGGSHQLDVGLAAIASGEYLIEISLDGAASDAKELIPLRVGT